VTEAAASGRAVLIEFTGPSCAGKSTFVRQTARALRVGGWEGRIETVAGAVAREGASPSSGCGRGGRPHADAISRR
jgi:adenylylsulfate kinase-like enzyme